MNHESSKNAQVETERPVSSAFWTCLLCGRSKFTRPGQPHRCQGGDRKRFKAEAKRRGLENAFIPSVSKNPRLMNTDKPTKPWRRFYFESNMFFDHIENMEDWQRLRDAYPSFTDEQLLDAKEATYGGHRLQEERDEFPNYGFRLEHDGERRLRDFFAENGMEVSDGFKFIQIGSPESKTDPFG